MLPKDRYAAEAIPLILRGGAFRNYTRATGCVGGVLRNGAGGIGDGLRGADLARGTYR